MIGCGYVGLTCAVAMAHLGHQVIACDKDTTKITALCQGKNPIYEPDMTPVIEQYHGSSVLTFSDDITSVRHCNIVFIAVNTCWDHALNSYNLKPLQTVVEQLHYVLDSQAVIVIKSTVSVGDCDRLVSLLPRDHGRFLVYNPEFLREGHALSDFLNPSRIVLGCDNPACFSLLGDVYQPIIATGVPVIYTNVASAEMIKISCNSFLATSISFANEIARICQQSDAHIDDVLAGMRYDHRIAHATIQPGPGYGGYCLPKDSLALLETAKRYQIDPMILPAVVNSNAHHQQWLTTSIVQKMNRYGYHNLTVLGLAFKAGTDDLRDSPALNIAYLCHQHGIKLHGYDPMVSTSPMTSITLYDSISQACHQGQAVVVLTEWQEFTDFDFTSLTIDPASPLLLFDYRNILPIIDFASHHIGV